MSFDDTETIELPSDQDNSPQNSAQDVQGVAGKRLKSFVERIERLNEERDALLEDSKEVYSELKVTGFDVKTVRQLIRLRKMDTEKRREEEGLLEVYKSAVGML